MINKINKYTLLFVVLILSFTGCSNKKQEVFITDNKIYSVALQHTKKIDIIESFGSKAIFTVTYLNYVNEIYDDGNHNFLVGVYIADKHFKDEKVKYTILNNGLELELRQLDENDLMFGNIPLENKWADYYFVFVPKEEQNNVTLELDVENVGNTILTLPVKN
jgi:hypothetical protein